MCLRVLTVLCSFSLLRVQERGIGRPGAECPAKWEEQERVAGVSVLK